MDTPKIAIKGLAGWHEHGTCSYGTYSRGPLNEDQVSAPIKADLQETLSSDDNPVASIWKRPNLDLSLPNNNVRNLFEGCVGCEGSTKGHKWNGELSCLRPSDAVGLRVYVEVLRAAGAKITE